MNQWDQNYSIDGYKYGTAPNAFVVEQSKHFRPNMHLLVPGDGEGRNGVWLAQQGHRVTSVDGSWVGLTKALALAHQSSATLEAIQADLAEWVPPPRSADAVVLIYVHLPPAIRQEVHRRLATALKPGGLLVLEAFHPNQLNFSSGGPKDAEMLYSLETLRADFVTCLHEGYAWEGHIVLDEGPGHQGDAYVTRWVGQAPLSAPACAG